jgi:tripeptidyl-peptidase-1
LSLVEHLTNAKVYSSNPRSSKYGNHYISKEVANLLAPSSVTVDVVKSWLVNSSIREERISQSSNKAWLQFDARVDQMELLLQAKYYYYERVNGGRKHITIGNQSLGDPCAENGFYCVPG